MVGGFVGYEHVVELLVTIKMVISAPISRLACCHWLEVVGTVNKISAGEVNFRHRLGDFLKIE